MTIKICYGTENCKEKKHLWSSQNRSKIKEVLRSVQDKVHIVENDIDKIIRIYEGL